MASPFFIIGPERSGTTLLRLILNAHSTLAVPEEMGYFGFDFLPGIDITRWENPDLSWEEYVQYVHNFLSNRTETLKDFDIRGLENTILETKESNLKHPYKVVLDEFAKLHRKQRWGEKTPNNVFFIDVLHQMFPEAKFIHIVRDPRSIVCSMNQDDFPWFSDDSVINALNWRKKARSAERLLEKHVPYQQRMLIRYEDLVTDPELSIRQVCRFLGEEFEPNMLKFYKNSKNFMLDSAATTFNKMAQQSISTHSLEKWRRKLLSDDVYGIEKICRSEMQLFKYVIESKGFRLFQEIIIWFKVVSWHWHCWLHRSQRGYVMTHRVFVLERLKHKRLRLRGTSG